MDEGFEKQKKSPMWLRWVGHMPGWTDILDEKSWFSRWGPIKFFNSFFCALGMIVFACNPVTGLFLFLGILVGNFSVAAAAVLAGSASVICNAALGSPNKNICNGLLVFNCVLFACVATGTIPPALNISLTISFWIYLLIAIVCTNIVDIGLGIFMSRFNLFGLSIPFNSVAVFLFLVLRNSADIGSGFIDLEQTSGPEVAVNFDDDILWGQVAVGALLGYGQVFGVTSMAASLLMWFGSLFCSPLLTLLMFVGSFLGTLVGVLFNAPPYTEVYLGVWAYNGLLTAGGLSYFLVQTPMGIFATIFGAVISTVIQVALAPIFGEILMPVWSFPFNITVTMILATTLHEGSPLVLVEDRTFPEKHLHSYVMESRKDRAETPLSEVPTIVVSEGEENRFNHQIDHTLGSIPEDDTAEELPKIRKGSDDDSINLDDIVFSSKLSRTRNSKVFLSPNAFSKVRVGHGLNK